MEKKKNSRRPGNPPPKSDVVFDTWLDTKLRTAYSSVLEEPVPDDLIKLLHQKLND